MAGVGEAGRAESGPRILRSVEALGPSIRRVLIGVFLIAAFAATGTVLLFVLTAQQLQTAMSAPGLGVSNVTIGAIRQDVVTVEYYYNQLGINATNLARAEKDKADTEVDARGALARMTRSAGDITSFINQNDTNYIRQPLEPQPFGRGQPNGAPLTPPSAGANDATAPTKPTDPLPSSLVQSPILDFASTVASYFGTYYAQLDAFVRLPSPGETLSRAELDMFKAAVAKPLQIYLQAHSAYEVDVGRITSLQAEIGEIQTQTANLETEVAPKDEKNPDNRLGNSTAYWNLCEDFYSFKTLVGERAYNIVLLPKMMLVLTLSIFMGILGSLIYISMDFLKNPNGRTFWDILFRIGLGAGVAFALFFFAAAGMLAMTQSSSNGAQADMSPYLISFLGITGGYLSDRVTQWMREVGENTFKVSDGGPPPRWAVGLDAALKNANLAAPALAGATGASAEDVESWVALTKPVPGDKQALVSAFLRLHPSHLFTDIQPG